MSKGGMEDKLEAARAQERQRLARDVHDALGGDLAAIKMALAVLGRRLPQDGDLHAQWAYIDKLVDSAIDSMHGVVDKTYGAPVGLLDQVLAQQIAGFSRQSGLQCTHNLAQTSLDMRSPAAQALYYILRECLVNAGRHAQARRLRVALREEMGKLVLEVEDDGVGPGQRGAREGTGLAGMRRRAEELGGEFSIRAVAPHGTLAVVELPMGKT
ncbi:MAG TPA: ATP-binding protein [Burkholderiaceae bacterium]